MGDEDFADRDLVAKLERGWQILYGGMTWEAEDTSTCIHRAHRVFIEVLEENPTDRGVQVAVATTLSERGDWAGMRDLLRQIGPHRAADYVQVWTTMPDSAALGLQLGVVREFPPSHLLHGLCLHHLGRHEEARHHAMNGWAQWPSSAIAAGVG